MSSPDLLSLLPRRAAAARTVEPGLLDKDPVQALDAPPPAHAQVAVPVPVLAELRAAGLHVLAVVLAQVVAEVVLALEGVDVARALGVVAVDGGELGGVVDVVSVALEVGPALECGVALVAADGNRG